MLGACRLAEAVWWAWPSMRRVGAGKTPAAHGEDLKALILRTGAELGQWACGAARTGGTTKVGGLVRDGQACSRESIHNLRAARCSYHGAIDGTTGAGLHPA